MTLTVTNNGVTISSPDSVQVTVTNFGIDVSPASVTVNQGQSASYTITLTPEFGPFGNTVSLVCSNLPSRTSCSFSPSQLTPGSSSVTSALAVSTTAPSASFVRIHWQTLRRWHVDGKIGSPWQTIRINGGLLWRWSESDVKRIRRYKEKYYCKGRGRKPRRKR